MAPQLLRGAYPGAAPVSVPLTRTAYPSCGGPHGRPRWPGHPLHHSLPHSGSLGLPAFASTRVGVGTETVPSSAAARVQEAPVGHMTVYEGPPDGRGPVLM